MNPFGSMFDSFELMKKAWASFNPGIPPSMTPTLDINELDKRIAELRAVEHWLSLNLTMLRNAIQGMEIQRGTLAAVASFGQSFQQATQRAEPTASTGPADPYEPPPYATFPFGMPPRPAAEPEPKPTAAASGAPAGGSESQTTRRPSAAHAPSPSGPPNLMASLMGPAQAQMANPAAWWDLLQNQFQQIAQATMVSAPVGTGGHERTRAAAGGNGADPSPQQGSNSHRASSRRGGR